MGLIIFRQVDAAVVFYVVDCVDHIDEGDGVVITKVTTLRYQRVVGSR